MRARKIPLNQGKVFCGNQLHTKYEDFAIAYENGWTLHHNGPLYLHYCSDEE